MKIEMKIDIDQITRPEWRAVAEALLRNDGDTVKSARELNVRRGYIYDIKFKLRKRGWMTGAKRDGYIATMVRDKHLHMGQLMRSIRLYDVSFQKWIADQTPEKSAVCDTLLSIAYDAYLDEVERKDAA